LKKAIAIGVIILSFSFLLSGCADEASELSIPKSSPSVAIPQAPNTRQPSIMVGDTYYFLTGLSANIEIDERDYLGVVTSSVPLSQIPTKNGESNFIEEGTPYAEHENGIVVLIDGKWIVLELWDDELINDYVNH